MGSVILALLYIGAVIFRLKEPNIDAAAIY